MTSKDNRLGSRRSIVTILFGAILIAGAWVGLSLYTSSDHAAEIASIVNKNSLTATAFEEHVGHVIRTADNALRHMKDEYESSDRVTDDIQRFGKLTMDNLSAVQMAIADENGDLIFSAIPLTKPINISHREHFKVQQDFPDTGLFISRPVVLMATGSWGLFLSQRNNHKDGSFAGINSVGIDPFTFASGKNYTALEEGRTLQVVGNDGIIRAHLGPTPDLINTDISKHNPLLCETAKNPIGSYELVSKIDNKVRIVSYRQMTDYPLIVMVYIGKEMALADFEQRSSQSIVIASLFTLFVLGFCFFLIRAQIALTEKNRQLKEDITERKQAEEALQDSEERFKKLSNLTFEGILIHDKGVAIDLNESLTRILGYTREELIGENVAKLCIVQDYHETIYQNIAKKYAKPYEVMGIKKDGTHFPIEIEARDIKSNDSEFRVTAIRDITERKQAEEALRISEDRYHELFNSVMEGIGIVDTNEIVQYCNPAFAEIFEVDSIEDMIGKCLLDFIPEDQRLAIMVQTETRKKGLNSRYEFEILTAKGHRRTALASISPKFDDNHIYCGAFGAVVDITETKRLQELESRAERLETAGTIAGQVAHDFNNLLAPLMAYPEFIREELPRNHPTLKYLDQIEKAAQKIADINQDLLAMGRRGHYNQDVLNLNTIVQHALSELEPYPETLACEEQLADDLLDILGGGAQLHRMISNLLHNAKDAMQDIGHINVRTQNYYVDDVSIAYGRVPKGEYVKLTISDTGCGIPDEIVQKIFDPFFTSKTTDKKRGSGLGMSVVDAVIKDHKGYIDLSTKVGGGTSFYIYFPITRETANSLDSVKVSGGNEKVLIVDDDDIQREVSSQLLKKLGYQVSFVESGEIAIEFIKESPQDLLILDMVMPGGIDGVETYRRILEISPHQKGIILSGFSESEKVLEAQRLGAGGFVRKPITKSTIAGAVRTELDRPAKVSAS